MSENQTTQIASFVKSKIKFTAVRHYRPELPSQCTHWATVAAQVSISETNCSQPQEPRRDNQRSTVIFVSVHTATTSLLGRYN